MATYIQGDIHEVIKTLDTDSVQLLYTNPPFGITECKWDTSLAWSPEFWAEIWRVMVPTGIVVLHASGKFADLLTASQLNTKRYEYVWVKNRVTGHMFSKFQPMRQTERVMVFYRKNGTYNRQMRGDEVHATRYTKANDYYTRGKTKPPDTHHVGRNPTDVLNYPVHIRDGKTVSDAMVEYFVRTYSNPGDTVLDMTCHNEVVGNVVTKLGRSYTGVDATLPAHLISHDPVTTLTLSPSPDGTTHTEASFAGD